MEVLIIFGIFAGLAYLVYTRLNKEDETGRHPLDAVTIAKVEETTVKTVAEVKAAEAKLEKEIVSVLDVNKDGKVNVDDVKEVVKKTKASAKKAASAVRKTKTGE